MKEKYVSSKAWKKDHVVQLVEVITVPKNTYIAIKTREKYAKYFN